MADKAEKDWTIMVYMAGDNNLSRDMVYSLREIEEAIKTKTDRINLLVYYDGSALNSPTLYCDFSDVGKPILIPAAKFNNDNAPHKFRPSGINQNAAAMTSIYQFVRWCLGEGDSLRNRRATNYALIVSGHGSGFQNLSFLKDNRSNYYMTIPKFRETLSWIRQDLLQGNRLDLVGFDNCVMGMIEIGNELREYAKVMVASEGYIPNAGWSYSQMLEDLPDHCDAAQAGSSFVKSFIRRQTEFAIGGVSVDIAAWDLDLVEEATLAVNKLGEILYQAIRIPAINEQLKPILLQAHYECQSYMFEQNVDLKDFCNILIEIAKTRLPMEDVKLESENGRSLKVFDLKKELIRRCEAVGKIIERCILLGGFSGGKYQYSNGVSIFFPWTASMYRKSAWNYRKLKFAKHNATYWDKFLEIYLDIVSMRPSKSISAMEAPLIAGKRGSIVSFDNRAELKADDPGNRTEDDPGNRTEDDPANRLLGAIGLTLVEFKNVAEPWYVFGFTKNVELEGWNKDLDDRSRK